RLALREDNARDRLTGHARRLGLIPEAEYRHLEVLEAATVEEIRKFEKARVAVADLDGLGERFRKQDSVSLANLLKQPGVDLADIMPIINDLDVTFSREPEVLERAAIRIRYAGYIDKQQREIDKFKRLESETIPEGFPFAEVHGLKTEAREKFVRFRPGSLGQAGRIEGVTPGDVAVLSVSLKRWKAGAGA
ncbi:tRNA uridine-5-carboxymethylaminomethyl(34) synthesis enzyme MnmG, partial [candidate division GN15 bacterium]|nr:tRNA uridine-5-carboxymethylaminomethyl(34) synthesis enzyme MnmG [candidate division GN15 bacterium]